MDFLGYRKILEGTILGIKSVPSNGCMMNELSHTLLKFFILFFYAAKKGLFWVCRSMGLFGDLKIQPR